MSANAIAIPSWLWKRQTIRVKTADADAENAENMREKLDEFYKERGSLSRERVS